MYAWEVDRATIELHGLRQEEWVNTALAALAFGLALGLLDWRRAWPCR